MEMDALVYFLLFGVPYLKTVKNDEYDNDNDDNEKMS